MSDQEAGAEGCAHVWVTIMQNAIQHLQRCQWQCGAYWFNGQALVPDARITALQAEVKELTKRNAQLVTDGQPWLTIGRENDELRAEVEGLRRERDAYEASARGDKVGSWPTWYAGQIARAKAAEAENARLRPLAALAALANDMADWMRHYDVDLHFKDWQQDWLFRYDAARAAETPHCHAGRDGDCNWPECPQEANNRANYQSRCPLLAETKEEQVNGD